MVINSGIIVRPAGLEPALFGLKGRCLTNLATDGSLLYFGSIKNARQEFPAERRFGFLYLKKISNHDLSYTGNLLAFCLFSFDIFNLVIHAYKTNDLKL